MNHTHVNLLTIDTHMETHMFLSDGTLKNDKNQSSYMIMMIPSIKVSITDWAQLFDSSVSLTKLLNKNWSNFLAHIGSSFLVPKKYVRSKHKQQTQ